MEKSIENYNPEIETSEEVASDKFDNHMKEARNNTLRSRRKILIYQSTSSEGKNKYASIKSSVY